MKKIVGIIAAAAFATSAFAEINIGSWNRAVVEPVHYDGDTVSAFNGPSWGVGNAGGSRTSLSFSASTENAGVAIDVHSNPDISVGDNSYVWVKPFDILQVKFGKIDNSYGRLDHCFGAWDASRFATMEGEGLAGVDRSWRGGQANFKGDKHTYSSFWETSSTMIGYKGDFGFIRVIINGQEAQKYKANDSDTKPAALFGLAADITAIENLTLKFGASIPTNLTGCKAEGIVEGEDAHYEFVEWEKNGVTTKYVAATEDDYSKVTVSANAIKAAVAADYTLDALTLHGHVGVDVMAKKVNSDGDAELGAFGLKIGAGADYAFNDAWKLIADFRFQSWTAQKVDKGDITYEDPAFGGYLGIRQQLTNATFEFGAMLGKRALKNDYKDPADSFQFAVPLTITASF